MWKNILLALGSSVVAVLLGEVTVRVVVAYFHRPPLFVSDARTGWAGRPNLRDVDIAVSGGHFATSTDEFGRRRVYLSSEPDSLRGKPTLVVVGDSFAYGISVSDGETFVQQMARNTGTWRIVNLGVPGFGSDQELLSLERFLASDTVRTVSDIVVLVTDNDFQDVQRRLDPWIGYTKPTFRLAAGTLERGTYHRTAYERVMDHSRLAWALRIKTTSFQKNDGMNPDVGEELVLACLGEIRRLGAARGARVSIFTHEPMHRRSKVSPAVWRDFLVRSGAINITDALRTGPGPFPIGYDGAHWNAEGNRRAARFILGALGGS